MKRITLAVAAALAVAPAVAAEWIPVSDSASVTYSAFAGSGAFNRTTLGTPIIQMTVRNRNKAKDTLNFGIAYVPIADCRAGAGTLVLTDMTGGNPSSFDYVADGGSNVANIGDALCSLLRDNSTRNTF